MQEDDVAHDVATKNDVSHDMETCLAMLNDDLDVHGEVEPCRKSNTRGIKILNWVELCFNLAFLWSLV